MPRTREPPPRRDVHGQSMLFPPRDCPPHPAGPPDGRGGGWAQIVERQREESEGRRRREERGRYDE